MGDIGDVGGRPWLVVVASHLAAISIVYTGDEPDGAGSMVRDRSSGREVERDGARDCVRDCPRRAESGASMPSLVGSIRSIGERSAWGDRVSAASACEAMSG